MNFVEDIGSYIFMLCLIDDTVYFDTTDVLIDLIVNPTDLLVKLFTYSAPPPEWAISNLFSITNFEKESHRFERIGNVNFVEEIQGYILTYKYQFLKQFRAV